jgi:DNA-binding transcriptional regulator YiaG
MTAAKKRNLFEEIREGLEAYRDRRNRLPHREFSAPDVRAIREQFGMSQADMATFLNVSKQR